MSKHSPLTPRPRHETVRGLVQVVACVAPALATHDTIVFFSKPLLDGCWVDVGFLREMPLFHFAHVPANKRAKTVQRKSAFGRSVQFLQGLRLVVWKDYERFGTGIRR